MPDRIVEVSREPWVQRLGGALKGVLVGGLLFLLGVPLLWWNEGRAVTTARSLAEGAAAVRSVAADLVDAANDGRLVHLSGVASPHGQVVDPQFGIAVDAIRLRRTVEMYQWREDSRSEERTRAGGGTERVTTTSYSTVWSSSLVDSSDFKSPVEHRNPGAFPVSAAEMTAPRVTVGAFTLSAGLVAGIDRFEPLVPGALPPGAPNGLRLDGAGFYLGLDPPRPQVGDVRVRFAVAGAGPVSVVARQDGSSLGPYPTRAGRQLEMLSPGTVPAAQMLEAAVGRNRTVTWLLRGAGWLLLFVGLATVLRPLAVVADVVPFLGRLARVGVGLVALLVSVPLALLTVAAAWLAYRPLLGGGLLLGAVALVVLAAVLVRRGRRAALPPLPGG